MREAALGTPPPAIVGDGLIGRAIRLAWLRRQPDAAIVSLDAGDDLAALGPARTVILATPVHAILDLLPRIRKAAPSATLVMDTGSTKRAIMAAAAAAGLTTFVGGHPMAGGTSTGPAAARADLFDGRTWFLTTAGADASAIAAARSVAEMLGATPVEMPDAGQAHDRLVAAISHLPQVVASALLATVGEQAGPDGLRWAGAGLRDTTRLAASRAGMWRSILSTNHDAVAPLLRTLAADLESIADHLQDPAAIESLFERAHAWLPHEPE